MPNTSKTVLVLCKEAIQLLVAGKTQKSPIAHRCETPSTSCSPWVRILTLDSESTAGGVYKLLLDLVFMFIRRKQGMREEDRKQSSEEDACKRRMLARRV